MMGSSFITNPNRYPIRLPQNLMMTHHVKACNLSIFLAFLLLLPVLNIQALSSPTSTFLVDFALGGIAGSVGAVATYPIDYVKSQLQTATGRAKYANGIDAFVQIVQQEGPWTLYRGVSMQVLGLATEKGIKLSVNEALCTAICAASNGVLPLPGEILAGSLAGFSPVILTNPMERIKIGLQTSNMTLGELLQREEVGSLRSLYRGIEACIIRDMIFGGFLFPIFAHTKGALGASGVFDSMGGGNGDALINIIAASVATIPAAFFATPADCVKTRLQNLRDSPREESVELALATAAKTSSNIGYALKTRNPFAIGAQIAQNEGVATLFSGSFERIIRNVPQFAVTLTFFGFLKDIALKNGFL